MAGSDNERALKELDEKLRAHKARYAPPPPKDDHYHAASQGWRMVIELVAGLAIGFGIGFGLDVLFGTMPIFLVLFVMLGFAAGVRVMLRTAKEFQGAAEAETERDVKNGD